MCLDRIPVTFLRWDNPAVIATAEVYGLPGDPHWTCEEGRFTVGVGFDMQKCSREKAREFGRMLRWVLRNDPDCDCEMWPPFSRSG